ncbi:MAG: HAD-IA family hydrolase [Clostridiales bacterium]|nr:HAD-IA family hydrolase [Clostridiales bacterium]
MNNGIKKHIIWDFDGTLFDTYSVQARAMRDVLKEYYDVIEDAALIESKMLVTMSHALKFFIEERCLGPEFETRFYERARDYELEHAKPFDGVKELLDLICRYAGRNYLHTHRGASAFALMDKYQLKRYFTDFVTGEDNFPRKPDPAGLLFMMNKHGIDKPDAIMIGDRELDVQAARNAGIASCLITHGNESHTDADYTAFELNDVVEFCLRL